MRVFGFPLLILSSALALAFSLSACNERKNISLQEPAYTTATDAVELGERLFNDASLSKDGSQSCASCHDAGQAFMDSRINQTSPNSFTAASASTGQDGASIGDINTPATTYVSFTPKFHYDEEENLFKGGLFLDGRASDLVDQAKQPFLNPIEMQTTMQAVVTKVKQKYAKPMQAIYGDNIFDDTEIAFNAIAQSIAAFESTERFSSFDSKFDKVLKGEAKFSEQEQRGYDLFKAEDKGNCAACHPAPDLNSKKVDSLFTDFTYDNLGVPKNNRVRLLNGKGEDYIDYGLYNNPAVDDPDLKGAFKVSSLRNVAVTGPYMHNGVFNDLTTVVEFYNSRDVAGALNPETKHAWQAAEVDATKNTEELGDLGLSDVEVVAIVAFLKTLTDERFEHMIK